MKNEIQVKNSSVVIKVKGEKEEHSVELTEKFLVEALAAIYKEKNK